MRLGGYRDGKSRLEAASLEATSIKATSDLVERLSLRYYEKMKGNGFSPLNCSRSSPPKNDNTCDKKLSNFSSLIAGYSFGMSLFQFSQFVYLQCWPRQS